ncbi:MAG: hypothetical protein ACI4EN_06180 [Butyrivibrio sp.]
MKKNKAIIILSVIILILSSALAVTIFLPRLKKDSDNEDNNNYRHAVNIRVQSNDGDTIKGAVLDGNSHFNEGDTVTVLEAGDVISIYYFGYPYHESYVLCNGIGEGKDKFEVTFEIKEINESAGVITGSVVKGNKHFNNNGTIKVTDFEEIFAKRNIAPHEGLFIIAVYREKPFADIYIKPTEIRILD